MELYESIEITPWFQLLFTENSGMAFGIEVVGKLFLTLFRIAAVGFIAGYLCKIVRHNYPFSYVACIALILAGAIGNIIDSIVYGVLFGHSYGQVASFMPEGGGYAGWLYGNVVDMFYFPLIKTTWPEWAPVWGGQEFIFFRPIFNLADAAICVGVFLLFIFYRRTFSKSLAKENKHKENAKKTV